MTADYRFFSNPQQASNNKTSTLCQYNDVRAELELCQEEFLWSLHVLSVLGLVSSGFTPVSLPIGVIVNIHVCDGPILRHWKRLQSPHDPT